MSEQSTANPPAANGGTPGTPGTPTQVGAGITADQIKAIVAEAVAGVAASFKTQTEALSAQVAGLAAKPPGAGVDPAAIAKLVSEQLTSQQAAKATADAAAQAKTDAAATLLKGVPAVYHKLGDDATKWADEAKAAREQFVADLKAAGITPPPVGSETPGGTPGTTPVNQPGGNPDLKGIQLISLAVEKTANAPVNATSQPAVLSAADATAAATQLAAALNTARAVTAAK